MGKDAVSDALIDATLELLGEHGVNISVRQIAARAGVNHALIYRHFGSKQGVVSAALDTLTARVADVVTQGGSAVDAVLGERLPTARILAWLILQDADGLVPRHAASAALVGQADASAVCEEHSPELRAALAGCFTLGWALYSDYVVRSAKVSPDEARDVARRMIEDIVADRLPHPEDGSEPAA